MKAHSLGLVAAIAVLPANTHAHHSQAMFDVGRVVTIEGEVSRYEWANPHVYIFLDEIAANGEKVEWKIETVGPGPLRRLGWSRDTLAAGDKIMVTGNPDRNETVKSINLLSLRTGNDVLYDSQRVLGLFATANDSPSAATTSLDGTWAVLLAMDVIVPLAVAPKGAVPLTAAGTEALASYDDRTMNPALECVPQPAPFFMYVPDLKRITTTDAAVTIAGDYEASERTIHLDVADHEGVTPSLHGHSIGRWEGETLVIDTAAFADHRTGNAFGVPSGPEKRLFERLTRNEDGTSLTYRFELLDPEFLAAPVTGEVTWAHRPNVELAPEKCSRENARRFAE
jgi:hypothetical protein